MKNYWISWVHFPSMGEFELHSPWWYTGYIPSNDGSTVCAAIKAESERDAKAQIIRCHDVPPNDLQWRFCEERPSDWTPFGDRFPRADWMKWD